MSELFSAGDHLLEGLFEEDRPGDPRGGVVVAHPHPLYGGTMAQPVVHRVARACRERGLAALRFNFRGVGRSGGTYSGWEEYCDVLAALTYLQQKLSTSAPMGLAGYSFGSVIAALAAAAQATALPTASGSVAALALIALPVGLQQEQPDARAALQDCEVPVLAVCGENDDIAPPESVARLLEDTVADHRLVVLPGAGHLFEGCTQEVGRIVAEFMCAELEGTRTAS
jgi:alpha/beta superfamily hydrolase